MNKQVGRERTAQAQAHAALKAPIDEKAQLRVAKERTERRDRFAAAALTGLLATATFVGTDKTETRPSPNVAGQRAVEYADALLAELDRTNEKGQ